MRLSSILLAVATVSPVLARCDALSTSTKSEQKKISTMNDLMKKNARMLRTTEMEKEYDDNLDSEGEERMNFGFLTKWLNSADDATAAVAKKLQPQQVAKLSKIDDAKPSYLNNPLLRPEGEALAAAKKLELQWTAQLSKTDKNLLAKINATPGAADRISRWRLAEWDPTKLAQFLKKNYPAQFTKNSSERNAWELYAALFLRQHFKVK